MYKRGDWYRRHWGWKNCWCHRRRTLLRGLPENGAYSGLFLCHFIQSHFHKCVKAVLNVERWTSTRRATRLLSRARIWTPRNSVHPFLFPQLMMASLFISNLPYTAFVPHPAITNPCPSTYILSASERWDGPRFWTTRNQRSTPALLPVFVCSIIKIISEADIKCVAFWILVDYSSAESPEFHDYRSSFRRLFPLRPPSTFSTLTSLRPCQVTTSASARPGFCWAGTCTPKSWAILPLRISWTLG